MGSVMGTVRRTEIATIGFKNVRSNFIHVFHVPQIHKLSF